MFENVKIKKLLLASFSVLLLLMAGVAYSGYSGMSDIDFRVGTADDMNDIVKDMTSARVAEKNFILGGDTSYVAEVNDLLKEIELQTADSKEYFQDPVNDKQMDDIKAAVTTYNSAFGKYVALENEQNSIESSLIEKGLLVDSTTEKLYNEQKTEYEELVSQNADQELIQAKLATVDAANQMIKWNLESRSERLRFMLHTDQSYADNVNSRMDNMISLAKSLETQLNDQADKEAVRVIASAATAYKTEFNRMVSNQREQEVATTQMAEAAMNAQVLTQEAREDQLAKMQEEMLAAHSALLVISLIAVIIGIAIALFISRMISKPVNEMLEAANRVAKGDLTVQIENESENELGQLSHAIRTMVSNLHNLISEVHTSSMKVASTSQEISSSSEEITAGASQISETVSDISKGAMSQSTRAEEVSRAMGDMTSNIQQIAGNAQAAATGATESNQLIQEVGKKSEGLLIQMDHIQEAVGNSAKVIRDLDGKSKKIGEIVDLITSIADQTNLLALNAAIEAARAGEQGRGFAVVADEVRKLAEDSGSAAKQIALLIQDIQSGTGEAVNSMEMGTEKVTVGAKALHETVSAVKSIVESGEKVAMMSQEIAAAAEEQAATIQEITSSVEEVSAIAEQSAAGTEQTSASVQEQTASLEELATSAQQLADLAGNLMEATSKFKIE